MEDGWAQAATAVALDGDEQIEEAEVPEQHVKVGSAGSGNDKDIGVNGESRGDGALGPRRCALTVRWGLGGVRWGGTGAMVG